MVLFILAWKQNLNSVNKQSLIKVLSVSLSHKVYIAKIGWCYNTNCLPISIFKAKKSQPMEKYKFDVEWMWYILRWVGQAKIDALSL